MLGEKFADKFPPPPLSNALTFLANGQWLWLCWRSGRFLTPEIHGSNPVIINFLTVNCIEKMKIKQKTPGMAKLKNLTIGYNMKNFMFLYNNW